MHTRRVLSAHGACSGSLCTGNREGKRGPVLFHLFQLEGNGGRQQRRNRSQRNHTRTDAVGPAQGACRGNRSTKSAEEPPPGPAEGPARACRSVARSSGSSAKACRSWPRRTSAEALLADSVLMLESAPSSCTVVCCWVTAICRSSR